MARLLRRPRSRGLGKRAWLVTWSIRLVLWTLGFTRIITTKIVNADVVPSQGCGDPGRQPHVDDRRVLHPCRTPSRGDRHGDGGTVEVAAHPLAGGSAWPDSRCPRRLGVREAGDGKRITGTGRRGVGRHLPRTEVREAGRNRPVSSRCRGAVHADGRADHPGPARQCQQGPADRQEVSEVRTHRVRDLRGSDRSR